MVNGRLGFAPKWSSARSEVFGSDRQIAAIISLGVAAHPEAPAESKGEVPRRIEMRHRGEVARNIVKRDLSAAQRMKNDPLRQVDPQRAARLTVDGDGSDHRAR